MLLEKTAYPVTRSALVVAPPAPAPPGTPVVIYAYLPHVDGDRVLHSVRRYVKECKWVERGLFVDYWNGEDGTPAQVRAQFQQALATVEAGAAAGIVTPDMGMVAVSAEEEAALAQWQRSLSGRRPFLTAPACMAVWRRQERRVRAVPEAVGEVRAWVTECLRPLAPAPDLQGDALLLVDEMLTNAIQHAVPAAACPTRTVLTVTVQPSKEGLYLAVDDPAPNVPLPQQVTGPDTAWEEHGRGLQLIEGLSEQWGSYCVHGAKRVWCNLRSTYGEAA